MKIPDYPSDPVLKLELETLFGLAFVPVVDVVDTWEHLKRNLSPSTLAAAATFLDYFQSTWMEAPEPTITRRATTTLLTASLDAPTLQADSWLTL